MASNNTNVYLQVVCMQFNSNQIIYYLLAYAVLMGITRGYPKRHQFVSNLISSYSCIYYLITGDLPRMISYYWYDLIIMLAVRDYLMIAHHIFTLYGILHCSWYPDYENIIIALKIMKTSDILMHHYKITDGLELEKKYPLFITMYQIFTIGFTCLAWLRYRIFYMISLFPFETTKANILMPLFLITNFLWIFKMGFLINRLCKRLKFEVLE
jgi:hypothetical protein